MHLLTLAVVQTAPTWADVPAAVTLHSEEVRRASARSARLAVFPELSLTGYDLAFLASQEGARAWLVPDDPRLDPLRRACAETGVTALVGAPVRAGDRRLLAALRVSPDGGVTRHVKSHLHGAERTLFSSEPPSAPFELDGWRVSVAICLDLATPSHAAAAAAHSTDLYVAGVVYDTGEERRLDVHGASRAMDHRMVVAAANTVGDRPGGTSCGASSVWLPDGSALVRAGTEPEMLVVTVDRDAGRALRD